MNAVALTTVLAVVGASVALAQTPTINLFGQDATSTCAPSPACAGPGGMARNLPPAAPRPYATMPSPSASWYQPQYQPQNQPQDQARLYSQYQSAGWNPAQLQALFASQLFVMAMLRQNQNQYQNPTGCWSSPSVDPRVYWVPQARPQPQACPTWPGEQLTYRSAEQYFGRGFLGGMDDRAQSAVSRATEGLPRSQRVAMLSEDLRAEFQNFMDQYFPTDATCDPGTLHRWLMAPPAPKTVPSTRYEALAFAAGVILGRIQVLADENGGRVPRELTQLRDALRWVAQDLRPGRYEPARFQRGDPDARSAAGSLCEALGAVRAALQPSWYDGWSGSNV